jgi:hypothetical protein
VGTAQGFRHGKTVRDIRRSKTATARPSGQAFVKMFFAVWCPGNRKPARPSAVAHKRRALQDDEGRRTTDRSAGRVPYSRYAAGRMPFFSFLPGPLSRIALSRLDPERPRKLLSRLPAGGMGAQPPATGHLGGAEPERPSGAGRSVAWLNSRGLEAR